MFEEQPQQQITTLRITMAIILFALAAPLGVWVLTTVNSIINDTKRPAILQQIYSEDAKSLDINTPTGKIEIPKSFFSAMPYFILYLYLIIPMTIAIALLKGGVSLLNPDLSRQLRHFVDSIRKTVPPKQ
jgi:hypothetical protein